MFFYFILVQVDTSAICNRATIGVQTSLDDQDLRYSMPLPAPRAVLVDKSVQVSPQLEIRSKTTMNHASNIFNDHDSFNSSSDEAPVGIGMVQESPLWRRGNLSRSPLSVAGPSRLHDEASPSERQRHPVGYMPVIDFPPRIPIDSELKAHTKSAAAKPKRKKKKNSSRSNGAGGRRGAVAETSFVNSSDTLLPSSGIKGGRRNRNHTTIEVDPLGAGPSIYSNEVRPSSKSRSAGGGRTSAMTGSRGTHLDAETISTILDMEDFSDS